MYMYIMKQLHHIYYLYHSKLINFVGTGNGDKYCVSGIEINNTNCSLFSSILIEFSNCFTAWIELSSKSQHDVNSLRFCQICICHWDYCNYFQNSNRGLLLAPRGN